MLKGLSCRSLMIETDPEIMSGVPVFVGTRVPLQTFFDYLEAELLANWELARQSQPLEPIEPLE